MCNVEMQKQEILSAKGHVEKILPAKDATCTEKGLTEGNMCTECGKEFAKQREIPALGHNYSVWTEDREAGELTRVCVTCGYIERKAVEQLEPIADNGAIVWVIVGVAVGLLGCVGVFCYFKWALICSWVRKLGDLMKIKAK